VEEVTKAAEARAKGKTQGEQDPEQPEELEEVVHISPTLKRVAKSEVDFLLGKTSAAHGLGEEEDDDAYKRIAKLHATTKGTGGPTPSAASSSAEPPIAPHPEAWPPEGLLSSSSAEPPIVPQPSPEVAKVRVQGPPGVIASDIPEGTTMRKFVSRDGIPFWEGKLPAGVRHQGKASCTRNFNSKLRSEEAAAAEVRCFLWGASKAGALG
jgi:hypothetical protein